MLVQGKQSSWGMNSSMHPNTYLGTANLRGTTPGFGGHRAACSDSALRRERPSPPGALAGGAGADLGKSVCKHRRCACSGQWALVWGLFLTDVTLTFMGLWATQWHTVTWPRWNLKTPRASWSEIFRLANVRGAPGLKWGLPPTGLCGGPRRST